MECGSKNENDTWKKKENEIVMKRGKKTKRQNGKGAGVEEGERDGTLI